LGAKVGGMSKAIRSSWYSETAVKFTKPLIEIIEPKIIIALGSKAYDVVCRIYGLKLKPMREIINQTPIQLPDRKKLFVVYHCSSLGIANRNFNKQLNDWRMMKSKL
jgi:uracil-DNA glycosylase